MTIEEIYEAMKNVPKEEMKRLDTDQRSAWKELLEYLKYDFEREEIRSYDDGMVKISLLGPSQGFDCYEVVTVSKNGGEDIARESFNAFSDAYNKFAELKRNAEA